MSDDKPLSPPETCRHCGTTLESGHYGAGLLFTCKSDTDRCFTPGPTYEQLEAEISVLREVRREEIAVPVSCLTKGVAEQLAYFCVTVHAGRFDDAGVHNKLAMVQCFDAVADQLQQAVSVVRLVALETMKEPKWKGEAKKGV